MCVCARARVRERIIVLIYDLTGESAKERNFSFKKSAWPGRAACIWGALARAHLPARARLCVTRIHHRRGSTWGASQRLACMHACRQAGRQEASQIDGRARSLPRPASRRRRCRHELVAREEAHNQVAQYLWPVRVDRSEPVLAAQARAHRPRPQIGALLGPAANLGQRAIF